MSPHIPSNQNHQVNRTSRPDPPGEVPRGGSLIGSTTSFIASEFFSPSSHAPHNLPESNSATVASFPPSTANSTKPFVYPKPEVHPNPNERSLVVDENQERSEVNLKDNSFTILDYSFDANSLVYDDSNLGSIDLTSHASGGVPDNPEQSFIKIGPDERLAESFLAPDSNTPRQESIDSTSHATLPPPQKQKKGSV